MKLLSLLLLLSVTAFAQESQTGVAASLLTSSGGGYSALGVGVNGQAIQKLSDRVTLVGQVGVETSKKVLIDSGYTVRGRIEGRVRALNVTHTTSLFGSAGVNYARLITKEYSKQAFQPVFGVGMNYDDLLVLRASYLLAENQTPNKTRGWRAGADVYLPLNEKFNYLFGFEYQKWRFYQPTGPAKGWNGAWVVAMQVGVSWKH